LNLIRNANVNDVPVIRELINSHAERNRMLFRSLADLYESVGSFKVFEAEGQIVGCCALHVYWSDIAEVKSLAVHDNHQGQGAGRELVKAVIEMARQYQVGRIFTLTLEKEFFVKMGFEQVPMDSLPLKVWSDCVHCPKQDCCDEIALLLELGR